MQDWQTRMHFSYNGKLIFSIKQHWYFPKPMNDLFSSLHWLFPVYALHYRAGLIWPQLHNCCLLALNSCSSSFLNLFCLIILFLSLFLNSSLTHSNWGHRRGFLLTHTHTHAPEQLPRSSSERIGKAEEPRLSLRGAKGIWDKRITPYCHTNNKTHNLCIWKQWNCPILLHLPGSCISVKSGLNTVIE